ncbi:SH3 domain-containing protein [Proteiniclasticum sp. C24MP]|uniref:SH3 domain-containing protein n=1 Tax=Proteiniclasticum sp. C24MP TaxID=3374101 RepID=UPI003754B93C
MKSVIRITTILLLIFGVGVMAPKMIQAAMIAQGDSAQATMSVSETEDKEIQKPSVKENEADTQKTLQNQTETRETAEINEETEENFPIKSAENENSVQSRNSASFTETTASVDSESTPVDKNGQGSNTTANASTAGSAPSAPAANLITFRDVSYTRWVTTPLNMRKGPGTEYAVLISIPAAEELKVSKAASNGWVEVAYAGKTGYVSGKYLSEIIINKPAPETVKNTPETRPAEPAPTPAPAPAPAPSPTPEPAQPAAPSYDAYKMYIGGKAITYKNGGQSDGQRIIDSSSSLISTWGGAATYSGTDGKNTHFIGHNPGIFSVMLHVSTGNTIIVTDAKGSPTTYKITRIFKVDDYGVNPSDGKNYYNYLTSTRGGEVITLQTCINDDLNLIIRADKIN